jgi:hypothetical protein
MVISLLFLRVARPERGEEPKGFFDFGGFIRSEGGEEPKALRLPWRVISFERWLCHPSVLKVLTDLSAPGILSDYS